MNRGEGNKAGIRPNRGTTRQAVDTELGRITEEAVDKPAMPWL